MNLNESKPTEVDLAVNAKPATDTALKSEKGDPTLVATATGTGVEVQSPAKRVVLVETTTTKQWAGF